MRRLIFSRLQSWKDDQTRKPVLLRGARQVGKTWIARELGQQFATFIETNFELHPEAKKIFHPDLDPSRIIRDLSLLFGKRIVPGESLIFFDEIQEEPKALQSLRYFYEMVPEQHVLAAGSLLDFEIEKIGLPVGRVASLYMYPISFLEFLAASGETLLLEMLSEHDGATPISEPVHQRLLRLLGEYLAVGGMPEVVERWCGTQDFEACTAIHRTICDAYRQDFNKYARRHQIQHIALFFDTIPSLSGRQFKFSQIPGEYRKRDLQPSLELLVKAGLVHKILHSAGQGIPLGAQVKPEVFKLIFLDTALAQSILGSYPASWLLEPETNFINKGEITEAFAGQELLAYSPSDQRPQLYFWRRQARGSSAEVDYLLQKDQHVIPVEVKSGAPGRLRSLRFFLEEHQNAPYGIRLSALNLSINEKLRSLPLYAIHLVTGLPRTQIHALL